VEGVLKKKSELKTANKMVFPQEQVGQPLPMGVTMLAPTKKKGEDKPTEEKVSEKKKQTKTKKKKKK